MKTVTVSPLELAVGDRVYRAGALMQVEHRHEIIVKGKRVAANICRLIGDDMGSIPRVYWDTPKSYLHTGLRPWAANLPEGLYWNVQGSASARVEKVVV